MNGLIVLFLPLALIAWGDVASHVSTDTRVTVRPPGASIVLGEIDRLSRPALVLLPFAALGAWRTRVYARQVIARESHGWVAVAEAAACAFGVMFVVNLPLSVTRAVTMPLSAISYSMLAITLGVLVGTLLRATALFVLSVSREGRAAHS